MFDVERVILKDKEDSKIREVLTRMSRFHLNMEFIDERMIEKAYIVESEIPLIFTRYTPDKVETRENVYIITELEKNGSCIYLCPGVIVCVMFIHKKLFDETSIKEIQLKLYDYFVSRIEGAYINGNDLLINNKKAMGLSFVYNNELNTATIHFMLTMKAENIKSILKDEELKDKKYEGITGVCDETGVDENSIKEMVNDFVNYVIDWRLE